MSGGMVGNATHARLLRRLVRRCSDGTDFAIPVKHNLAVMGGTFSNMQRPCVVY